MSKVRFALVGCASIARKHARALHQYLEQAEIGAFVDLDLPVRSNCPSSTERRHFQASGK